MIEENVFWFYLGLSWILMIAVGVIILRRNNSLLKRNAELELALVDAMILLELNKIQEKKSVVENSTETIC